MTIQHSKSVQLFTFKRAKGTIGGAIFEKSLTSRDVQVILDITQAFPGGLMIEVLNVDDEIFGILEAEAENELMRQIYILLAIVSSLLSVLSVLVYARMSLRPTTS